MTNQPTDAQIEAERRAIVKATVEAMTKEGATIAHVTVAKRLERDYPGFQYIAKVDDFRAATGEPIAATGEPIANPEPMDVEQLRAALHVMEMDRAETRQQLLACEAQRADARSVLASSIHGFISSRPIVSSTAAAQNYCEQERQQRQQMKDKGMDAAPAVAYTGRSAYDRAKSYATGGTADDFVRKNFLRNGGNSRGAMSQQQAARVGQERRAAAAAAAAAKAGK